MRSLLGRFSRATEMLEGAVSLHAPLGTSKPRLFATAAALTEAAEGKNQDRFVLKPLPGALLAGIFDGHSVHSNAAGQQHAEAAARHLAADLWKRTARRLEDARVELDSDAELRALVERSFAAHQEWCEARYKRDVSDMLLAEKERLEKEIGDEVPLELPQEGGTTATVAILHGRGLLVAWVGDSRALMGVREPTDGGELQVIQLTCDHNLDDENERKRLLLRGGKSGKDVHFKHVSLAGVEGSLKVTRSLGDSPFHKNDVVSCRPDVRHYPLTAATRFVLIASDGIWDHLSNEQVGALVDEGIREHERAGKSRTEVAESVIELILARIRQGQADGTMDSYVDDKSIVLLIISPSEGPVQVC
ncbi:hypothetical protein AB1Y20_020677 [Prymnesium parvum]|uniref:PPM-type phosphatase domain-containing protein n=1 Tax=Prymnesium parvum TaxID=97485 RepID=A0AB34JYB6_PRYPA